MKIFCCFSLPSGSCQASKRSDSVGGFPGSAYSVLLRFLMSRSHEAPSNAVFWIGSFRQCGIQGWNHQPNALGPLVSRIFHVLTTQLLRPVIPPLLVVQHILLEQERPRSRPQLSEISVVVQKFIDFLQVDVLQPLEHIEFQTTTVKDCIRQTSVVSTWQPHSLQQVFQSNSSSIKCS